jgi:hypothetical protein
MKAINCATAIRYCICTHLNPRNKQCRTDFRPIVEIPQIGHLHESKATFGARIRDPSDAYLCALDTLYTSFSALTPPSRIFCNPPGMPFNPPRHIFDG